MAVRSTLRRYHVWLGWLIAIPMLFWTISGVIMVARPIDEVRGTDLIRAAQPIASTAGVMAPKVEGRPLASMTLERRASGPCWVLSFADGGTRLADPATGALLPPLSASDAAREVTSRYTGTAKVIGVSRTDPDHPPLELRKPIAAWRVAMSDDTYFYVDAGSGWIVARRIGW